MTIQTLRDYLGVDESADPLIEEEKRAAYEHLKRVTGVDWEQEEENSFAGETVKAMVYLNFYGVRDDAKNMTFLQKYIDEHICQLQFSKEALSYGQRAEGNAAST